MTDSNTEQEKLKQLNEHIAEMEQQRDASRKGGSSGWFLERTES